MVRTRVGYSGGVQPNPSYHNIKDHAESIQVEFDPSKITFEKIIRTYFRNNDASYPRSGQYRPIIYYHNEEQKNIAQKIKEEEEKKRKRQLYVEIQAASDFYLAEDYHQKYYLQGRSSLMKLTKLNKLPIEELIASPVAAKLNGILEHPDYAEMLKKELASYNFPEAAVKEIESIVGRKL